jgi:hypothetical protein
MGYKCRLISQQFGTSGWDDFTVAGVLYSPRIPLEEADGLAALYDPSDELLRFKGPKIWFTIEPSWHYHYRKHPVGKKLLRVLDDSEHVYFGNPDPRYRVPVATARSFLKANRKEFKERAVATVNYCGGRFWWAKRHAWLRNRMITCPLVELYGSEKNWSQFSRFPFVWKKGLPSNFCGTKAPGLDLHDPIFLEFLSGYKVYVCLENSYEPDWFTEKFVNAVRAGCIPVYHPHPTVEKKRLKGAYWVDPKDFSFNPRRTIEHALAQDIHRIRGINDAWLDSGILADTAEDKVMRRVYELMAEKISTFKSRRSP